MKLMTDKMMDLEIERRMREERERVWTNDRFDRLEKKIYELEMTVEKLKHRLEHPDGECEMVRECPIPECR